MEDEKTRLDVETENVVSISCKIDELLSNLGKPGRYQLFIFLLLLLNYFPVVFSQLVGAFYSSHADHTCDATRGRTSVVFGDRNYTVVEKVAGECETYLTLEDGINTTLPCYHGDWIYQTEERERTIVTEWDLVCDDAYLRPLSTTIYFCGVMIGGLVLGYLADKYGRRPVMLVTLYSPIVFGIGIFFTPSYIWYVIARFLEGLFVQSLQMTSYIIVVELFLPQYRPIVGALLECLWGASIIALGGIAYLIRDWRYIQLAVTLPRVLAIFYICVIPESLRWMIMHGKMEAAEKLIDKISRFNNVDFPSSSWRSVKEITEKADHGRQRGSIVDLVRNRLVRKRSLILFYIWYRSQVDINRVCNRREICSGWSLQRNISLYIRALPHSHQNYWNGNLWFLDTTGWSHSPSD